MTAGARHLVLVGLMATGKSTVGRLLAGRLDRPLVDSDEQVEARTGRTVREIWTTDGEPAFRAAEREALLDALASDVASVVAAAGGVVLDPETRRRLQAEDLEVVWLRADPAVLAGRATSGGHRPLLDADPAGTLARMAEDRNDLYAEVADSVVDVDRLSPDEVADRVLGCRAR